MDQGNEARSPKSSLFIGEEVSESESPADHEAAAQARLRDLAFYLWTPKCQPH